MQRQEKSFNDKDNNRDKTDSTGYLEVLVNDLTWKWKCSFQTLNFRMYTHHVYFCVVQTEFEGVYMSIHGSPCGW